MNSYRLKCSEVFSAMWMLIHDSQRMKPHDILIQTHQQVKFCIYVSELIQLRLNLDSE